MAWALRFRWEVAPAACCDRTELNVVFWSPSQAIGDIVIGSVLGPSSQRANECRIASFFAGIPEQVPVRTVNRWGGVSRAGLGSVWWGRHAIREMAWVIAVVQRRHHRQLVPPRGYGTTGSSACCAPASEAETRSVSRVPE